MKNYGEFRIKFSNIRCTKKMCIRCAILNLEHVCEQMNNNYRPISKISYNMAYCENLYKFIKNYYSP